MTDAELNLKLARMMGLNMAFAVGFQPDYVLRDGHAFDPINNGADFDAVLMYARRDKASWGAVQMCVLEDDPNMPPEMFRRTVCEDVVEANGV